MDGRELAALGPEAFLSCEMFKQSSDSRDLAPYKKGLHIGRHADEIHISVTGSWSANMSDGTTMSANERIGVHPNTGLLYCGFLDSKVPIILHRVEPGRVAHYGLIHVNGVRVIRPTK